MTNIDDVINSKIDKYAGAMEALAKGEDVMETIFDPKMQSWAQAMRELSALRKQLATRDALIERLVEAGDAAVRKLDGWVGITDGWIALVAEYRSMNGGTN